MSEQFDFKSWITQNSVGPYSKMGSNKKLINENIEEGEKSYDIDGVIDVLQNSDYEIDPNLENEMDEIRTYGGNGITLETLRLYDVPEELIQSIEASVDTTTKMAGKDPVDLNRPDYRASSYAGYRDFK